MSLLTEACLVVHLPSTHLLIQHLPLLVFLYQALFRCQCRQRYIKSAKYLPSRRKSANFWREAWTSRFMNNPQNSSMNIRKREVLSLAGAQWRAPHLFWLAHRDSPRNSSWVTCGRRCRKWLQEDGGEVSGEVEVQMCMGDRICYVEDYLIR